MADDASGGLPRNLLAGGLALSGITLFGLFLALWFGRTSVRPPAPRPVIAASAVAYVPPAALPAPTTTRTIAPMVDDRARWTVARRVRDRIGETLAAGGPARRAEVDNVTRELQVQDSGERTRRLEERERREIRMNDLRILVAIAARREISRHAESLGLTILERGPVGVKFADDLLSGTASYRLTLNESGLIGAKTATLLWTGRMTWEVAEDGENVTVSPAEPNVTELDPSNPGASGADETPEKEPASGSKTKRPPEPSSGSPTRKG